MPRPNKTKSQIRSGRFKFKETVPGEAIILAKTASGFYRFFNGGKLAFDVRITDSADDDTDHPVEPNCSLDLQVAGDSEVSIHKDNVGEEVEGVYEAPGTRKDIASGRFTFPKQAATTKTIVFGGSDGIYRLINSGENVINVGAGRAANHLLKKDCSFDVFVKNSEEEVITLSIAAQEAVQGVYDLLNENGESDVRSGRFNSGTVLPTADMTIIDFKVTGTSPVVAYRIYNSGEKSFRVFRGTIDLEVEVHPDTSIEIEIPGNTANRTIVIKPSVVGGVNQQFEGVYEFLGKVN